VAGAPKMTATWKIVPNDDVKRPPNDASERKRVNVIVGVSVASRKRSAVVPLRGPARGRGPKAKGLAVVVRQQVRVARPKVEVARLLGKVARQPARVALRQVKVAPPPARVDLRPVKAEAEFPPRHAIQELR